MPHEHLTQPPSAERLLVRKVPEYLALDLDRCIADTDHLQALLAETVLEDGDMNDMHHAMHQARVQTEESGGSFDTARWTIVQLTQRNMLEKWHDIKAGFIQRAHEKLQAGDDSLFMPGAEEFFRQLRDKNLPFGIITYGGEEWQRMKLAGLGLDQLPLIITDQKDKGKIIAEWERHDGFHIPTELLPQPDTLLLAERVVLVDDKATSFQSLPDEARGFQVRSGVMLPSQRGPLPHSVEPVDGLLGVIEAIEKQQY